MYTYTSGEQLRIMLLEDRMSFKNFAVTLLCGEWPDLKKIIDSCETGYQYADIKFFHHDKKAYIKVYTD